MVGCPERPAKDVMTGSLVKPFGAANGPFDSVVGIAGGLNAGATCRRQATKEKLGESPTPPHCADLIPFLLACNNIL
jgi:hypothetical protein